MHEVTKVCERYHCFAHEEDEVIENPYLVCGECFHRYPTAKDLATDYHDKMTLVLEGTVAEVQAGLDLLGEVVHREAEAITFCAHCSHDF